ncbi:MAG TPA: ABC transporter ATP-binding protein, partial [Elusimicrobia bacterium]|nr:ABC transporter ATP-binding protein [Elusimicrobiota bacterium]
SHIKKYREVAFEKIKELLNLVGMPTNILSDYPHQFSGGQRQRIGIARALAMQPEIIIADEPVSSLDVSIQAQILNLLLDLKQKFSISYIFITHDLSIVTFLADYILVMYQGNIIEEGKPEEILTKPKDKYTEKLFNSLPKITCQIL